MKFLKIVILDKDGFLNMRKAIAWLVLISLIVLFCFWNPITATRNAAESSWHWITSLWSSSEEPAKPRPPIPSEVAQAKAAATPEQLSILQRDFDQQIMNGFKTDSVEAAVSKFQATATENDTLRKQLAEANTKTEKWKDPIFVGELTKQRDDALAEVKKKLGEISELKAQIAQVENQKVLDAGKVPTDAEAAKAAQINGAEPASTTSPVQQSDKDYVDKPAVQPKIGSARPTPRPTLEERRQAARERNSPPIKSGVPETVGGVSTTTDSEGRQTTSPKLKHYPFPKTKENLSKILNGDPDGNVGFDRKNKVFRFRDQDPEDGLTSQQVEEWARQVSGDMGRPGFRFIDGSRTQKARDAGADPFSGATR